jgi:hypothetical protein
MYVSRYKIYVCAFEGVLSLLFIIIGVAGAGIEKGFEFLEERKLNSFQIVSVRETWL